MTQIISTLPVKIQVTANPKAVSIMSAQKQTKVIAGGGGRGVQFYRLGVNYDGGHAASKYGDFPTLDGGLSANASRNPV